MYPNIHQQEHFPTANVTTQIHMMLFCFGFYGNGAGFKAAAHKCELSTGSVFNAQNRVSRALVGLMNCYIQWPDATGRQRLCRNVIPKYGYKWCFFAVDSTTHPFLEHPTYQRATLFDRKKRYTLHALVTNTFEKRVIHLVVGWLGSKYDAKVMRQTQ